MFLTYPSSLNLERLVSVGLLQMRFAVQKTIRQQCHVHVHQWALPLRALLHSLKAIQKRRVHLSGDDAIEVNLRALLHSLKAIQKRRVHLSGNDAIEVNPSAGEI